MRLRFGALALSFLLVSMGASAALPSVNDLVERLRRSEDFRVRVQAALELGKTADPEALDPLLGALDDPNASVRTAAVRALEQLGDPQAVPSVKAKRGDPSESVRKQVAATLSVFENGTPPPRLLVKIGSMKNQTTAKVARIEAELEDESRKMLDALPRVDVLGPSADCGKEAEKQKLPVVMVSGQIQKLKASREGGEIVYSASVEYILHTMPDQSIAARVSGSASGTLTQEEANDEKRASKLRQEVLDAAIASALRRAPRALLAAARL